MYIYLSYNTIWIIELPVACTFTPVYWLFWLTTAKDRNTTFWLISVIICMCMHCFSCFIIDNSGFIVAHDDFKGQSSTEHKDQLENIHIIKKEPSISAHMINEGSLQARSCVDHQKHRTQKTWEVCTV